MTPTCGHRAWYPQHALSCVRSEGHTVGPHAWERGMAQQLDRDEWQRIAAEATDMAVLATNRLSDVVEACATAVSDLDVDPGTTRYSAADVLELIVGIAERAQGRMLPDGRADVGTGTGDPGGTGDGAGRVDRPVVAPPVSGYDYSRVDQLAAQLDDSLAAAKDAHDRKVHGAEDDADAVIAAGMIAFHHTREYVGLDVLPAIDGWSWWDWCKRATAYLRRPGSTSETVTGDGTGHSLPPIDDASGARHDRLDSTSEADRWKTWPVTHAWGVRWYVGRAIDGEDVAMFATFNRERDARLVAYALNAIGARALDSTSEADR